MDVPELPQALSEQMDAYVKRVVAKAPPLTEAQKDRIRLIFQPVEHSETREAS